MSFDTGYLITLPSYAYLGENMVRVADYPAKEAELYILTYWQEKATPLYYIYGKINPKLDLVKSKTVTPKGLNAVEYSEISSNMLVNSQIKAMFVALTSAGFEAEISSEGVLVEAVVENGSSFELLEKGDLIVTANGSDTLYQEQLREVMKEQGAGGRLTMEILRGGEELTITVPVGKNSRGEPSLGIFTHNKNIGIISPVKIDFNERELRGGPSAGLIYTLEIYNRLMDEDVTIGRVIAGTGQINLDGSIGEIEGMKQKVYVAEKQGANILFCPKENYEEAISVATDVKVVAVSHFSEVIAYLAEVN